MSIWYAGSLGGAQSEPRLTVYIYNYAEVSGAVLDRAEREAARIFEPAAALADWVDCPLTPDQAAQFPGCQATPGPTIFALRLVSRAMAQRYHFESGEFGFAPFPEPGELPTSAFICAECVEKLARGDESRLAAILGCMMAHELGHLLLGQGSHAATGIMHAPWSHKELEQATAGNLTFLPWQVQRIRVEIQSRTGRGR